MLINFFSKEKKKDYEGILFFYFYFFISRHQIINSLLTARWL